VAKDVTEGIAEGVAAETAATATATARCQSVMTVLVIDGALLLVAQHFCGFLGFLEFLFGRGIVRIAIRMVFHRLATIGLLDVCIAGVALLPEYFVLVAHGHGRSSGFLQTNKPAGARFTPASPSVKTLWAWPEDLLRLLVLHFLELG